MSEYFRLGYDRGYAIAWDCRKEVLRASYEKLGEITGAKLDAIISKNESELFHIKAWRIGFFEGFMSRAEKIQGVE